MSLEHQIKIKNIKTKTEIDQAKKEYINCLKIQRSETESKQQEEKHEREREKEKREGEMDKMKSDL
jgi:hypothetical protein